MMTTNRHQTLDDEVAELATKVPLGSTWRHHKGGEYTVTGYCLLEHSARPAVLYEPELGIRGPWARDGDEFTDGRYTRIDG